MANIYKGEYLDVSTLYIGQKIEEGFKLLRDQVSISDPSSQYAELITVIRSLKSEQSVSMSNLFSWLETFSLKMSTTNKHLVNLKHLAPPPEPLKDISPPDLGDSVKEPT